MAAEMFTVADLNQALERMRKVKRVVICQEAARDQVQAAIDQLLLGGLVRVLASPYVPDGQMFIIREPSVDDILGIDPDWTGHLSTDEYVEYQRSLALPLPDVL